MLTLRYGDSRWAAEWLRLTGAALGKAERGDRLAVWFEKHVAKITALGEAVPAKSRPRVLHLTRAREALVAAGKGTSMDGDIRRTGGINLAGELPGFSQISVEQILAWNPDIILLNNFEPGLTPAFVYADPRFVGIKAVREKRVYLFPRGGFRWDPPSQETPLAMEWLYGIFHPQQPATGLRARIAAAYLDLYGYRVTEAEIDQILRLPENGRSVHYAERFGKTAR
jgi:iron complex transport system substrate-binding protein